MLTASDGNDRTSMIKTFSGRESSLLKKLRLLSKLKMSGEGLLPSTDCSAIYF